MVINKPYLTDGFSKGQVKGTGAAPSEHKTKPTSKKAAGDDTPTSTPKRKTRAAAGASASAKKKKAKASADDDDEDDDDDNDDEFDDSSSGSNGSNGSTGSGGKKGKAKSPKMVVRKPCKDCEYLPPCAQVLRPALLTRAICFYDRRANSQRDLHLYTADEWSLQE